MRKVGLLDATGLALLRDLARKGAGGGFTLVLSEMPPQPLQALRSSGLLEVIGADNVAGDIDLALARARPGQRIPNVTPSLNARKSAGLRTGVMTGEIGRAHV